MNIQRAAVAAAFVAASWSAGVTSVSHATPIAFTGGTVHPVSGPDIAGGTVVIDGAMITAVGASVAIPAGAEIVHCEGKHLYPGWVAAWTQLGLTEISSVLGTDDTRETGEINPNIRAEIEINPESELIPVTRVNGITAALSVPSGGAIAGTSALMHLNGWTYEDMTLRAPVALHVNWPASGPSRRGGADPRTPEQQRKDRDAGLVVIRQTFDDARAYWKARDAEGSAGVPRHDRDVKWEAMGKALKGEIPVAFHCGSASQIRAVLHFVDEQKLTKVLLFGGTDAPLFADELKARHIGVIVAGTQVTPRHGYDAYDSGYTLPARLAAAGIAFAISDGGGSWNERNLPYHAGLAVGFGLSHDDALKSISLWPAQLLGVGDKIGSLEAGKLADLQITTGDPLDITTRVERVYINGALQDSTNRQSRLFDKYDHRPRGPKARPR